MGFVPRPLSRVNPFFLLQEEGQCAQGSRFPSLFHSHSAASRVGSITSTSSCIDNLRERGHPFNLPAYHTSLHKTIVCYQRACMILCSIFMILVIFFYFFCFLFLRLLYMSLCYVHGYVLILYFDLLCCTFDTHNKRLLLLLLLLLPLLWEAVAGQGSSMERQSQENIFVDHNTKMQFVTQNQHTIIIRLHRRSPVILNENFHMGARHLTAGGVAPMQLPLETPLPAITYCMIWHCVIVGRYSLKPYTGRHNV